MRNQKKIYFENKIDKNKHNAPKMRKTLKALIVPKTKYEINEINFRDEIICDPSSIAEKFNAYFVESVTSIYTAIPPVNIDELSNMDWVSYTKLDRFEMVSINVLRKIIFNLENKQSIDSINAKLLKETFAITGFPLLHIINTSL